MGILYFLIILYGTLYLAWITAGYNYDHNINRDWLFIGLFLLLYVELFMFYILIYLAR